MQFVEWSNDVSFTQYSLSIPLLNLNEENIENIENENIFKNQSKNIIKIENIENSFKIENDLIMKLYVKCPLETLFHLIKCNKRLFSLTEIEYLWFLLCKISSFHPLPLSLSSCLPIPLFKMEGNENQNNQNFNQFKRIFKENLITKRNWLKGHYRSWLNIHLEKREKNDPIQRITPKIYLYFDKTRAISISIKNKIDLNGNDNLVNNQHFIRNDNQEMNFNSNSNFPFDFIPSIGNHIWDMQTGRNIGILPGHICCVKMDKWGIVTGHFDGLVKIWNSNNQNENSNQNENENQSNLKEEQCHRILYGHQKEINCLQITKKFIVTGSEDCTIRIWKRDGNGKGDYSCLNVLKSSSGSICCLALLNNFIYSGSVGGILGIWLLREGNDKEDKDDNDDGEETQKSKGKIEIAQINLRSGTINCIQAMNNLIVVGCKNGLVHILTIDGSIIGSIQAHHGPVVCLQFNTSNDILVTGSTDSRLIVWNLKSREKLYEINDHKGTIWNIHLDETRLISSGFDNRLIARYFGLK